MDWFYSALWTNFTPPLTEGPIPPEIETVNKTLIAPWIRLEEPIFPESEVGPQFEKLLRDFPHLQHSQPYKIESNLIVRPFAIAHPVETAFGQTGIGWVFFLMFGQRKAFQGGRKKFPIMNMLLPALRAGPEDISCRVPAVRELREKNVLVVGLGAVGAPVAIELARNGCGTLHMLEHDVVEPGNTIRWPLGASAWGKDKLEALKKFLDDEYPATKIKPHPHCLGQPGFGPLGPVGDDDILDSVLAEVDLVLDGSASQGVTNLLFDRCREAHVSLISLFATPNLEGGAVVLHGEDGGCPNCLHNAWIAGDITPPPGLDLEDTLTQPPGCAERTFIGASYDLQELSLQAVRLAVDTLSGDHPIVSLIQTLSFVDEGGRRCPPSWSVDPLPIHSECNCRR